MPSALVQKMAAPTPKVSTSADAATTNSGSVTAEAADLFNHSIRLCSLAPPVIRELSLHAPHLLRQIPDTLYRHHSHRIGPGRACSAVVRHIAAPIDAVWSVVRRFDNPLTYKHFLKSCRIVVGDGLDVGTLREVRVISGIPAEWSTERLEVLDDERHVISFSVIDGEHRLNNYTSVMTLHAGVGGGTVVVESYVVDVPVDNSRDETCLFADTIVRCNLNSLARIAEKPTSQETAS